LRDVQGKGFDYDWASDRQRERRIQLKITHREAKFAEKNGKICKKIVLTLRLTEEACARKI